MKTKININGIDVEITLTDEQVKQITEASKHKLFEYVNGSTYCVDSDYISSNNTGTSNSLLKHGRYRRTKKQAEMDFERQTRMMRLSALALEVGECVDYKYELDNSITAIYSINDIFMTYDTAIKVCEILNSGEYSLDVE